MKLYEAEDFESFWVEYRALHSHPVTRGVHAFATLVSIVCIVGGLWFVRWEWLVIGPLPDHAIAQASHRWVEGNRTTPGRRPVWHMRAEWRLFRRTVAGMLSSRTR